MKIRLYVLMISLLVSLASCYTAKKAGKDLARVGVLYPQLLARCCEVSYRPLQESYDSIYYLKGTEIFNDTIYSYIDCDTVSDKDVVPHNNIVSVPCPVAIKVTDTVVKVRYRKEVNFAKEQRLQNEVAAISESYSAIKGRYKLLCRAFALLLIYTIVRFILRFWKIKLP